MAIIKKFNKALDNISGDVSGSENDQARIVGMSIGEGDLDEDEDTSKIMLEKAAEKLNNSPSKADIDVKAFDEEAAEQSFDSEKFAQNLEEACS